MGRDTGGDRMGLRFTVMTRTETGITALQLFDGRRPEQDEERHSRPRDCERHGLRKTGPSTSKDQEGPRKEDQDQQDKADETP